MKERFREEIPKWLRLLGAWRINTDSIDFNWGYFAPRAGLKIVLNRGTYFDQRYAISFCLGWGEFMVYLPFKTKLNGGCDMPQYGFAVHSDTFWIYKGGYYDESLGQVQDRNSSWSWFLPFFSYVFIGHWIKDKNFQWAQVDKRDRKGPYTYEFRKDGAYIEVHPYTYKLKNGTIQNRTATCTIEKREWHRKWFPFLMKKQQVIDIEFNDEVGERSGTWKGGIIGCSYEMLPGDTILTSLLRMEAERKF